MIVAAAIKMGDLICTLPKPARHHNILSAIDKQFKKGRSVTSVLAEEEGFLTDQGQFLGRQAAYHHARKFGPSIIRKPDGYQGDSLFSEDVW